MVQSREQLSFESQDLQREIKKLRHVDNFTNLLYLVMEYFCLIAVIGSAVAFAQFRVRWGLAWSWNIPVFATAIVLIGGIQHRLAGLGHEASHYSFMKNRFLNDLIFRSAHLPLIISEFPSVPSLRVVWMPDRRIGSVDGRANSV